VAETKNGFRQQLSGLISKFDHSTVTRRATHTNRPRCGVIGVDPPAAHEGAAIIDAQRGARPWPDDRGSAYSHQKRTAALLSKRKAVNPKNFLRISALR